jgi:hypothetical protein
VKRQATQGSSVASASSHKAACTIQQAWRRKLPLRRQLNNTFAGLFTDLDAVLIIKDFTIALEALLEPWGFNVTDVSEPLRHIRRATEEAFMQSIGDLHHESRVAPELVTNCLQSIVDQVDDIARREKGISVEAKFDPHNWLLERDARRCLRPAAQEVSVPAAGPAMLSVGPHGTTPAWTGLKVTKSSSSLQSTVRSSINQHGGRSSVKTGKKRRDKPDALEKNNGKYKTT